MGIDYGMGTTNIDHKTGIRFGVINQNEVLQAWADSSEPNYGEPSCPECGNPVIPWDEEKHEKYPRNFRSADYACEDCEKAWESGETFGDEPAGYVLDDGEYEASSDSYGDVFITKSPYYTRCGFCSPCAPGAGYLTSEGEDCKAYCFSHDWFDDGKAPYKVYRVSDDSEVMSDED